MSISLPEIDGRIITKTIAFKEEISFDKITQTKLLEYIPHDFGINYICNLVKTGANYPLLQMRRKIYLLPLQTIQIRTLELQMELGSTHQVVLFI